MSSLEAPTSQSQNAAPTKSVTWASKLSTLEPRISDFDIDEDEDEGVVERPIHPHPLTAFLPPLIFTSHLTPSRHAEQPFPYNMSPSNGIISWSLTFIVGSLFFWIQATLLSNSISKHPVLNECRSLVALYAALLVVEFFVGICSSLYPLVYGCVLRGREGSWPRAARVWGCEAREESRARGSSGMGVRIAKYTLVGILILAIWRVVRGEENLEGGMEEKMRLVEEGRGPCGEKLELAMQDVKSEG